MSNKQLNRLCFGTGLASIVAAIQIHPAFLIVGFIAVIVDFFFVDHRP